MGIVSGGSGPFTRTATLTTNANTFISPTQVFDLGSEGPHVAIVKMTALVLVTDGETFGNGAGTIYAGADTIFATSADGITWSPNMARVDIGPQAAGAGGTTTFEIQGASSVAAVVILAGRYVELRLEIFSNDTGVRYAGANHPTAQVRFDFRYTQADNVTVVLPPLRQESQGQPVGIVSGGGGGGGSITPVSTSATFTANRASGFEQSHTFDLGRVAPFYIASTITASNADGETWGRALGEIAIDLEAFEHSPDGSAWVSPQTALWYDDTAGGPGVALFRLAAVTARYVRVLNLRIIDSDFNVYAGPNNPSVTARFDVQSI